MIDLSTCKKAWALLNAQERRIAMVVLVIIIIGALSTAAMVGSVLPFLIVLSEPNRIQSTPLLAWSYDAFGFTSVYGFLVVLGLTSFGVIVLSSVIQIVRIWAIVWFSCMRTHAISYNLLSSYLAQPYTFFLNRHSSDMAPRVLQESGLVVSQFFRPAADFIAACLTTLSIVGLLLWLQPLVTAIAFIVLGGIYGVIYIGTRRKLRDLGQIQLVANRARFRMANESIAGIKDIKLLSRETTYLDRYACVSTQWAGTQIIINVLSQVPQFALQGVAFGGIILLCLLLVDPAHVTSGSSLKELVPVIGLFTFSTQRLMPELSKLYQSLTQMQAGIATVDAVYEDLVLCKPDTALSRIPVVGLGLNQALRIDALSYSYPNSDQVGLRDISVTIRAGEKIGIVGSTGAGKTTLADIVLGLLEPDHGRIVVDGQDVTQENLQAWMHSVGYVPQDIFLTDAPVAENIAFGVPPEDIDFKRVRNAARIARIDQFVMNELPEGYETHIGERGVRLSGGQRQRIGVARALYNDADLIVFDEATSALDNLTEAEVIKAIDALPGDKTVLMIAHRLSTVRRCDRIIMLDKGRLVGCDSWDALMAGNEAFQKIARVVDDV